MISLAPKHYGIYIHQKQRLTSAASCPILRLTIGREDGLKMRPKPSSSRFLPFQGSHRMTAPRASENGGSHQPCEEVSHVVKT
jgi:hypothetical protein